MLHVYVLVCAALTSGVAPDVTPRRVLLVADNPQGSSELTLLHQALQRGLLADPQRALITSVEPDASQRTAADLWTAARDDAARGRIAFNNLQVEAASAHYAAALQKLHRFAALTGDLTDLPDVLAMLVATYLLQGERDAAMPLIRRLYVLKPDYALSSAIYNPDMASTVRAVLSSPNQPTPRAVTLDVAPADASIWIDGQLVGTGGMVAALDPTIPHYVLVVTGGALPYASVIELEEQGTPLYRRFVLTTPRAAADQSMYLPLLLAARHARVLPDRDAPSLAGTSDADEVWVLTQRQGTIHRVRFDLHDGRCDDDAPSITLPLRSWQRAGDMTQQWLRH